MSQIEQALKFELRVPVRSAAQPTACMSFNYHREHFGKTWDLRGSVPLNPHVGHTITVTGTIPKESKGSSDTSPQNHLVVTKVEKVRDECKQP